MTAKGAKEVRVRRRNGRYQLVDDNLRPIVAANKFLAALDARGLSPHTIRAYAFDLAIFYRWLKRTGRKLQGLKQSDLLDFVAAQRQAGVHPHSINRRLTTCRLLYRFCTNRELDSGYASSMPAPHPMGQRRDSYLGIHKLKKPSRLKLRVKAPHKIVEPLTRKQVRAFLRSLRRYRDIAIAHLMLLCGMRSQEILDLEVSDILFEDNRVRVRGKGDKERLMPLPDILVQSIGDYIRLERPPRCSGPKLFVVLQGSRRGHPMTPAGLRSLFRRRRLNPTIAMANPHRFRHTFGADMARAGVRLPVLQKMMGHAHSTTTLQYINLSMEDIADEYKRAVIEIQKRYDTSS